MAGISHDKINSMRTSFLEYVESKSDNDGYAIISTRNASNALGLELHSITRYLKYYSDTGAIEYERDKKGSYIVKLNGKTKPKDLPSPSLPMNVPLVVPITKELRTCPKCKTKATNSDAKFCYKCGSCLLSEKELLKAEFNNTLGFICRVVPDQRDIRKIMDVLQKVSDFAFGGEN